MLKVYLASGWFNPAQKQQMDEIYEVLKNAEDSGVIELFAPFYDGIVLRKDDPNLSKKMRIVWQLDIAMVRWADLIVASTQDHDVGTIFECGYASAIGKTIFCYNSNPEFGLNVMLAQEARAFVKTQDDLRKALIDFRNYSMEKRDPQEYVYNCFKGEPI